MSLSLVTPPASEPLVWAGQAQKQLRLDGIDDDKLFVESTLIPAARERAEGSTRRQLLTASWQLKLDRFPGAWLSSDRALPACYGFDASHGWYIEIPKPPLVAGSVVITYVDMAGVTQTWSATNNYVVDAPAGPRAARGRIGLQFGAVWPIARPQINAVTIAFDAGYGAAANVPPLLLQGMLLDLGTLYENREDILIEPRVTAAIELPTGCQSIYRSFRSLPRQRR